MAMDSTHTPGSQDLRVPFSTTEADIRGGVKRSLKWAGIATGMAVAALPALTCRAESLLSGRDEFFLFWGQLFALAPGLPGKFLRKCYYRLTVRKCSLSCDIGFMSYFNDRRAEVGERVYIGFGVSLGAVSLGDGCLIGSRASIMSGGHQHRMGPDGRLTAFERATATPVKVGEETWIGEAALLMADVGSRSIVAAGSVVARPVPDGCLVGGNPARFVRRLTEDPVEAHDPPTGGRLP